MPYIPQSRRNDIKVGRSPINPGELNYAITHLILEYVARHGEPNYRLYNEVMGVLSCVQQELYRRRIATYESRKKKEHGDVY